MDSKHEQKFLNLILKSIETNYPNAEDRYKLLKEFFENEKIYYEIFCDIIYKYSNLKEEKNYKVFLENQGVPHVVTDEEKLPNNGFVVLTSKDIQSNVEDIIIYIEIALNRLKNLVDHQG